MSRNLHIYFLRCAFAILLAVYLLPSCGSAPGQNDVLKKNDNSKFIKSAEPIIGDNQRTVFEKLLALTGDAVAGNNRMDSLAFLILPVQASCPSCREKTIDSLVQHLQSLKEGRFIIISANGGRKTIGSYFKEQGYKLPATHAKIILDTVNTAFRQDLYIDKPTMYYTSKSKAYKKVSAIPETVRNDLHEFFSGAITNYK